MLMFKTYVCLAGVCEGNICITVEGNAVAGLASGDNLAGFFTSMESVLVFRSDLTEVQNILWRL